MTSKTWSFIIVLFFFFQAEDGIRDYKVTGVQTCALPIFGFDAGEYSLNLAKIPAGHVYHFTDMREAYGHKNGEFRHRVAHEYRQVRGDIDRESGVEGKRGGLGGRRIIKKKKKRKEER